MLPTSNVKPSSGISSQCIAPSVTRIDPIAGNMLSSPVRTLPSNNIMKGVITAKAMA